MPEITPDDVQAFSVRFPKAVHNEFRHTAFDENVSMNEVVVELVKQWLTKRKTTQRETKKTN